MKRSRLAALALVLVIGAGGVWLVMRHGAGSSDDTDDNESALVTLTPLKKGSAPVTIDAYGTVEPSYASRQSIAAPLAARVSNVTVRESQTIAQGTPMMTLIPTPESRAAYELAKQLAKSTESLAQAHLVTAAELAKARSELAVLEEEGAAGPSTIKAPFDAVVMSIDAAPGAVVAQGAALIELARPNDLILEVGLVPAQAVAIKAGNKVVITPLGVENQTFSGTVQLRGGTIGTDTGLVAIEISVPPEKVLPGEMARATITTGEATGYIVPHAAVMIDDDTGHAYVVQAVDMAAKKVEVKVISSDGDTDVVDGEFEAGAPVVVEGAHQLDDDMKVRLSNDDEDTNGDADTKGTGK